LVSGNLAGALRIQPLAMIVGGIGCACFAAYTFFLFCIKRVPRLHFEPRERRTLWVFAVFTALLNWLYLVWRGV
jgi:hypothetical protein